MLATVRVVALLAAYDEERFIANCIEHHAAHGIETYLIDNESTDATVEIAERYRGRGLAGLETFPRSGSYRWLGLLARKAELASTLEADWFLHVDADELRLPPHSRVTLSEALVAADREGYNAVNFLELTFVPTLEEPVHDHPRYVETMRRYYAFLPVFPHRLNAWKRQDGPVDLVTHGGHRVEFPGLRMYPESFPMRHYLFLSIEHAKRKYVERRYDAAEVEGGWHRKRAALREEDLALVSGSELREFVSDDRLDTSDPLTEHPLFAGVRV